MGRTIIVGDVHGCSAELSDLLSKLGLLADDRLLFVGDLVARGPDSRGVLRTVRETRARATLGNHEQRLLGAREAERRGEPLPRLGKSHKALLRELDPDEWAQLEALPLRIELEEHGIWIVHAGLLPGVPFENHDPWLVTHLRSISEEGVPSERWGPPWGARWQGPAHVVFGHNAAAAPQIHPYATGLDTGCVYGGALTALVLPEGEPAPSPEQRRDALFSVPARQAYVDYGQALP